MKYFRVLMVVMVLGCGMQLRAKLPVAVLDTSARNDNGYNLSLSQSFSSQPGELEYYFSFFIGTEQVGKTLGFGRASASIQAYQEIELPEGGTLFIRGTFEKPIVYYVGGLAKREIKVCASAKDTLGYQSNVDCQTISFKTSSPPLLMFSLSGTVTGLVGTLSVQDSNGNMLVIDENGKFTLSQNYHAGDDYEIELLSQPCAQRCILASSSGTIEDHNVTDVSLVCIDKSWDDPQLLSDNISPDGQNATAVDVDMNDVGDAVVVWQQSDGANTQIFYSLLLNNIWTHPTNLADNISPDGTDATRPKVAIDNQGNIVVTWLQSDGANVQAFRAEYRLGVWALPVNASDNISPEGQDVMDGEVSMDNNGNTLILWRQSDGANTQIFKSEYRLGIWTDPVNLADNISPDGKNAFNPTSYLDDSGQSIIVWRQLNNVNRNSIFKAEYRLGVWTYPASTADFISNAATNAFDPEVAMDNDGQAIIVWRQLDGLGGNFQVYKAEYRLGAWSFPVNLGDNISVDTTNALNPEVSMDDNGQAVIVWYQNNGLNNMAYRAEYRLGAWSFPAVLGDHYSPAGQDVGSPKIDLNNSNQALGVWKQSDGVNQQTFRSEYRSGAWTDPADIADNISLDLQDIDAPRGALSNHCSAVIAWSQSDGLNAQTFISWYH